MGVTKFILRMAVPTPKILHYDRFLFIGPHPDDIEIGAGATIARLTAMGKKVTFLICLDGRFGLENAPEGTTTEELAKMRQEESINAAKILGVEDVRFLNFSDGGLYDTKELTDAMARAIGEISPEILFAPDPAADSECHADHLNVGEIARRLAFFAPFEQIMAAHGAKAAPVDAIAYYMTAKPNAYVKISGFSDKQLDAILAHKSQFPADSKAYSSLRTYLKLRAFDFGLRSFSGKAEGFRVLGRTHMHCLPEA